MDIEEPASSYPGQQISVILLHSRSTPRAPFRHGQGRLRKKNFAPFHRGKFQTLAGHLSKVESVGCKPDVIAISPPRYGEPLFLIGAQTIQDL